MEDIPSINSSIIDLVVRHYASSDSPYLLSALGSDLKNSQIEIPVGFKLQSFIDAELGDTLECITHPQADEKIAVAPLDKAGNIRAAWAAERQSGDSTLRNRLPLSLLSAFCRAADQGKKIFISLEPPFQYKISSASPGSDFLEIEQEWQPSSLRGRSIRSLTSDEKRVIHDHICKWAHHHSLDLLSIFRVPENRHMQKAGGNALQRLIDAQTDDMRSHLLIPADVASALMRLP